MSTRRRMSRLGWFFLAVAVFFGVTVVELPPTRSDVPGIILFLAVVVPVFFALNWLALRFDDRRAGAPREGEGRPDGIS